MLSVITWVFKLLPFPTVGLEQCKLIRESHVRLKIAGRKPFILFYHQTAAVTYERYHSTGNCVFLINMNTGCVYIKYCSKFAISKGKNHFSLYFWGSADKIF